MYSKAKPFSRVYVEEAVRSHPRTTRLLERFPKAQVVMIDDYKNVFGRGGQDFWKQKASMSLVIGRKREGLLYRGNDFLQSNLSPNFCYNTTVLNCPYDCHYCYLQGMYPSGHLVAFVNLEDFFAAAEQFARVRPVPGETVALAISYDADLLAFEGVTGFVAEWTEWARQRDDFLVEVRTKSAAMRFVREVEPTDRIRLVWTLSPEEICHRYESGAPALGHRLAALRAAADRGWRVGICVDPVLRVSNWQDVYARFAETLKAEVPWGVERLEIGVFRISSTYFKRMQNRPGTDLLHYPYEHANKAVSYQKEEREELMEFVRSLLAPMLSHDQIFLWT